MKETPEQLKELISRFSDPDQARRMAEEIQQIESRMASLPSPPLRPELRCRLRAQTAASHSRHRAHFWQALISAAACLAVASVFFFSNRPNSETNSSGTLSSISLVRSWEERLLADADMTDKIAGELDDIVNQLEELQAPQWDTPAAWQQDLMELENSDSLVSTNFWKG